MLFSFLCNHCDSFLWKPFVAADRTKPCLEMTRPLTDEALQQMHARNLPKEDFDSHDARPYLPLFEAWVIEIDQAKLTRPLTDGE